MSATLNFKKLRQKSGLNQKEFGKRLGVGTQFISNIERGVVDLPPKYYRAVSTLTGIETKALIRMAVRKFETQLRSKVFTGAE